MELRFQTAKRSDMSSAIPQRGRFADSQKSRFQGAKCSNMCSAVLQLGWFADAQESHFQAANRSNMGNVVLQECWLATSQESPFQAAKRSYISSGILQWGRHPAAQESSFQQRTVKIWLVPTCKGVNFLILKNRVFRLLNVHVDVATRKDFDLLMLMKLVFRVRIIEIWLMP